MSNRNDEVTGLAMIFAFIAMAFYIVILAFLGFVVIMCIVLTVLSLFAWNKPVHIGRYTIEPEEARAFIKRGLWGAAIAPALTLVGWMFTPEPIVWGVFPFMALIGYVLGSIGLEWLFQQIGVYDEPAPSDTSTNSVSSAAQQTALPAPPQEPFRYASWDDEEERRS